MGICENPSVLSAIRIVNIALKIIRIAVPIILIVFGMIEYMNATSNGNLKEANKKNVKRAVFLVIALLLPTLTKILFSLAVPGTNVNECIDNATLDKIEYYRNGYSSKLIENLATNYSLSNYKEAVSAARRIEDFGQREQALSQLKEYEEYVELEKRIQEQDVYFEEEKFKQVYKESMAVSNESAKEYLKSILLEVYPELLMVDAGVYSGGSYNVYIPEMATTNMPLVLFLHGMGNSGDGFYQAVNNYYEGYYPMIVLGPEGGSTPWTSRTSELVSMVKDTCSKYKCDESKISIFGFSMGAAGLWALVNENPEMFSRGMAVSASGSIDPSNFKHTKIMAMCGTNEPVEPGLYNILKDMVQSINSSEGDATLQVFDAEHGSMINVTLSKIDNIEWLIE